MTRFLLIRHAQTDTAGKVLTSRSPGIFLNEEGRDQAKKLAERLRHEKIEAIYCSPLERALQTAEPLAAMRNLKCITSDDFNEVFYGNWTNCSVEELKDDQAFRNFNSFRSGTRIPGGELMAEAQLRIVNGLDKLHSLYPEMTLAIVSHADMIRAAVAWYAGISLDMFQRIEISPASISIIELHDYISRIIQLNERIKL